MSIDHYEQFISCRYVHYSPRLVLVWFVVVAILPSSSCPFFSLTDLPRWFHHNISYFCQSCDLGSFTQLKSFYLKHLKSYILADETRVNYTQFDILYARTREADMNHQYITAD